MGAYPDEVRFSETYACVRARRGTYDASDARPREHVLQCVWYDQLFAEPHLETDDQNVGGSRHFVGFVDWAAHEGRNPGNSEGRRGHLCSDERSCEPSFSDEVPLEFSKGAQAEYAFQFERNIEAEIQAEMERVFEQLQKMEKVRHR